MLKSSHAAQWLKTVQIEYDAIEKRETWQIIDKSKVQRVKIVLLKWVFKYKIDNDDFLDKFKTRIVVREDLQIINNAQNVYVAILASKIFRMLMIMMIIYKLKTRQLNAINVYLNAKNDESIYCYMSNEYKQSEKIYKVIRTLYEQRKFLLLWFRMFTAKCIELNLKSISKELCLFIDQNDIIIFFYVKDIIWIFRFDREKAIETFIFKLKTMFEFKNMSEIKKFLDIRIIIRDEEDDRVVYLIQDAYIINW
jgi:hypothetical protein